MRVVATDSGGVVSGETILEFEQTNEVVSARYLGGTIVDGYSLESLIGQERRYTSVTYRSICRATWTQAHQQARSTRCEMAGFVL
jgi:hypothetical protein